MTETSPTADVLMLGSAMWGWTVDKNQAFQILDAWYAAGERSVDTATNYPIDRNEAHFRLAENILAEWIKANGIGDLKVNVKVGSLNNLRSPEHLLTQSFLLMMLDEYQYLFGGNLHTFMIHWDNREDLSQIEDTFQALEVVKRQGYRLGISGIRHPELYASLYAEFKFDFDIQLKHNVVQTDVDRYSRWFPQRCFFAYGINAGGLKLDEDYDEGSSLRARGTDPQNFSAIAERLRSIVAQANQKKDRPPLQAMYQIGLIYAAYHPQMKGVLVGPSKVAHVKSTLEFFHCLRQYSYKDVFEALC